MTKSDGQESRQEDSRQAPALSPEGDQRRADERAAAGAARRDLFRAARHPQEAHRAVPDLAERAGARPSGAGARRACALQDLAVAAAVGNRDPAPPRRSGRRITSGSRTRRWPKRPASSRRPSRTSRPGATPKSAAKDELAIIDFVKELYKTRRVSDKTYKRVHAFLGDAGVVELVGICGYYAMISMTLNVFRAQIPEDAALPFAEPK